MKRSSVFSVHCWKLQNHNVLSWEESIEISESDPCLLNGEGHVLTKATDLESGINGIWGYRLWTAHTSFPSLLFPWSTSLLPFQRMLCVIKGPSSCLWGLYQQLKYSPFLPPLLFFFLKQKSCVWTSAPSWQGEIYPRLTATILPSPPDRRNPHSWNQSYLGGIPELQACSQHKEPPRPIWVWRWGQIPNSGNQQGGDIQRAATEDTWQEKERQTWKTQGAGKKETANSVCLAKHWHGWEWARRGPPIWHLCDIAGAQFTVTGFCAP